MREEIFKKEMARRGLNLLSGYVTYDSVRVYSHPKEQNINGISAIHATQSLLSHPEGRPTAIIGWRDETALLAMREAQDSGLRVPDDLSIIGFSDITAAHLTNPPLSTIQSPWESMERLAVQEIIRRSNGIFSTDPITHLVPTHFVARQSTGPTSF